MIKQVVRDIFFLAQKSEPATKEDVGRRLSFFGWCETNNTLPEYRSGIL